MAAPPQAPKKKLVKKPPGGLAGIAGGKASPLDPKQQKRHEDRLRIAHGIDAKVSDPAKRVVAKRQAFADYDKNTRPKKEGGFLHDLGSVVHVVKDVGEEANPVRQVRKIVKKVAPKPVSAALGSASKAVATPLPVTAVLETAKHVGPTKTRKIAKQAQKVLVNPASAVQAHPHEIVSGAVKAINETMRPTRAIMTTANELAKGKRVDRALSKGGTAFVKNKGALGSDVLKTIGAPKWVQTAGGFALDIVADPTTYVTFGAGTVAKSAARAAAMKAAKESLALGASKAVADRAARAAARKAIERESNKGIQVGVRAKIPLTDKVFERKTSGRTTAAISRKAGITKAGTKVRESEAGQTLGTSLVHDFKPAERTAKQHDTIRAASREYRAAVSTAAREAHSGTKRLRKAIGGEDHRVGDIIESGKPLKDLGNKAPVAREIRRMGGESYDLLKSRDLINGPFKPVDEKDAQRYLARVRQEDVKEGKRPKRNNPAGNVKVQREHVRDIRAPLADVRAGKVPDAPPDLFTPDLAVAVSRRRQIAQEKAAKADYWKKVASTGQRVTKVPTNHPDTHMLFRVDPHGLTPLAKDEGHKIDGDLVAAALRAHAAGKGGRVISMPKIEHARAVKRMAPGRTPGDLTPYFDKVQGLWKTAVTVPNPAYHARNLYGDTFNAWLGDTSANSYRQAVKAVTSTRRKISKAEVNGGPLADGATVKVGGTKYTSRQLLEEAEKAGAVRQGFTRELADLQNKGQGKFTKLMQGREDIPRFSTYLSARKRGMTPQQATEWTNKHHFDYGDLTPTETGIRRAIPFYTFAARNTRLQVTKLITRPGKHAAVAKALNEAAKSAGYQDYNDYAGQLPSYAQRGLPVPLKFGKHTYSVSLALPATDLNQLTTDARQQLIQNIGSRVSQIKIIAELAASKEGYSLFFDGPIQRDDQQLSPAPGIVAKMPGPIKKALGIEKYNDPRRGVIWGWPGKVDYAFRAVPQSNVLTAVATPGATARNVTPAGAAIGMVTGAKSARTDWQIQDQQIAQLGKKKHELEMRAEKLRDTDKDKVSKTDASQSVVYKKTLADTKTTGDELARLKLKRGDKPRVAAKRVTVRRPNFGDGGLGGGLGGGGLGGGL